MIIGTNFIPKKVGRWLASHTLFRIQVEVCVAYETLVLVSWLAHNIVPCDEEYDFFSVPCYV